MDLELVNIFASIGTAGATIALVLLLYKAIKQMEVTVKLSQVQTEYQFRPWIGPSANIRRVEPSVNDKIQFEVLIKNFGELPAQNVLAKFTNDSKQVSRKDIQDNSKSSFDIGPMLPNMEKRYWIFFEREHWDKVCAGSEDLFIGVYFEYDANNAKNGYGLSSQYVVQNGTFVHKDMWIDSAK